MIIGLEQLAAITEIKPTITIYEDKLNDKTVKVCFMGMSKNKGIYVHDESGNLILKNTDVTIVEPIIPKNNPIREKTKTKEGIVDYLKQSQYVETVKGWVKGFVIVYLDKKTFRIKHTINKGKGSRLYAKSYKDTIRYFERYK